MYAQLGTPWRHPAELDQSIADARTSGLCERNSLKMHQPSSYKAGEGEDRTQFDTYVCEGQPLKQPYYPF